MAAWRMVGTYFLIGTQAELRVYSPMLRIPKPLLDCHRKIVDNEQVYEDRLAK